MRPIPAPRRPDAVPMPDGDSRDWVTHPGPEAADRFTLAPCHARRVQVTLAKGLPLLDAVAQAVEAEGADGACAILDGVTFDEMNYVMPDGPVDDAHAAWYSETHHATGIRLDRATASVGKRDGAWFLHTHAMWRNGSPGMGHLLNDQCILGEDCQVTLWLLEGARLEVALDAETNFPLFRPTEVTSGRPVNAGLLTVRPHEDLRTALEAACTQAGMPNAEIHGIGSLIGAGFADGTPMAAPLSEVLLYEGCRMENGTCQALPLACVDPEGGIFEGDLLRDKGPVCVTFEMLLVAA